MNTLNLSVRPNMRDTILSQRVVRFILTRKDEDLAGLNEKKIADIFDMEQPIISRRFENDIKISINKFISRERIYRAVFAIDRNPDISVIELSVKLGFREYQNFIREFKNLILLTPDRYINIRKRSSGKLGLKAGNPIRILLSYI